MPSIIPLTMAVLALTVIAGVRAADDPPHQSTPPGLVRREFIFTRAPFAQCHASTLAALPAGVAPPGSLIAAWFGGDHEGADNVGIWISRKVDGKWSPPVEVADGVQFHDGEGHAHRFPCWNPVLFQPRRGPLMLFYKCGPHPSEWWGMLMHSTDGGRSWSRPRRLPEGILGPVKDKPIELPNGSILCPTSDESHGWRVFIDATDDLADTWRRIGPLNDGQTIGAIQPTLLTHRDGSLQMLCRSREDRIMTASSKDAGRHWSAMTPTDLPNPNSGIDAVTLADGRQLLVYNHTTRKPKPGDDAHTPHNRAMLNVAVSNDGQHWQAALTLENEPNAEFSYPAVIQTPDGLVHITYTWKRRRITHIVLNPTQLQLRDMPSGEWPR